MLFPIFAVARAESRARYKIVGRRVNASAQYYHTPLDSTILSRFFMHFKYNNSMFAQIER